MYGRLHNVSNRHRPTLHVHGVTSIGKVEATRLTGGAISAETKCAIRTSRLGHTLVCVLLIVGEVLLDNVVGLHVNILVGVVLAVVNLLHTTALFDEEGKTVDGLSSFASSLLVKISNLENVLKTVQGDLDDLVIGANQEIAEGFDTALRNKIADLLRFLQSTRRCIANSPASLLTGLEVSVLQEVDQGWNNVCVDYGLNLGRVARSNVGDCPAGFLADTVLGRA